MEAYVLDKLPFICRGDLYPPHKNLFEVEPMGFGSSIWLALIFLNYLATAVNTDWLQPGPICNSPSTHECREEFRRKRDFEFVLPATYGESSIMEWPGVSDGVATWLHQIENLFMLAQTIDHAIPASPFSLDD